MDNYNEAILEFIHSAVKDGRGLSHQTLAGLYEIRKRAKDPQLKEELDWVISRIVLRDGRFKLETKEKT